MSHTDLSSIIDHFSQAKVLCVGDVMLDKFVYGNVERISPEAPVPVLHYQNATEMLGGAGNVIRNIASLKGHSTFISVVGNDDIDQVIQKHLQQLPHCQHFLIQDPARHTTLKTRYIAGHQQVLRIDHETVHSISDALQDQIYHRFCQHIQNCDIVVLSDYGKGLFNPVLNQRLIEQAHIYGKPIIVDPKSHNFQDYAGATIITPNFKEFQAAAKIKILDALTMKRQALSLREIANIEAILITRGSEGMSLFADAHCEYHLPTVAQEVFDVSGAGDTVVATLALACAAGAYVQDAMQLANHAAGLVVAKLGTACISDIELKNSLQHDVLNTDQLETSWACAQQKIKQWRQQNLKIGLTNGCFDLLHPGHLSLLTQAKTQCDKLIVALNSDTSVQSLKGPRRPINKQQDRALILSHLNCVDHVVIFDESTPLELIKLLQPDVLIKGQDYTAEQVVGAQEVISWGGQIYLAKLIEGKSTTKIIEKC